MRYVVRAGQRIYGIRANQCNQPGCLANTGESCKYVSGPKKGQPRRGFHKVRRDRAIRTGMLDIRKMEK